MATHCYYKIRRGTPRPRKGHPRREQGSSRYIDARVHCAVLKKRTAPQAPLRTRGRRPWPVLKTRAKARSLRTQQRAHPGQAIKAPVPPPSRKGSVLAAPSRAGRVNSQCSTRKHGRGRERSSRLAPVLLRKEVIQPHLPVRQPCYDFVPIADPTFDSSLPYGLGHRLRVLPTFVT